MDVKIVRLTENITTAKRGVLLIDGEPKLVTLELPWRDNRQNVSCIPVGEYECQLVKDRVTHGGMRIPETYEVCDVPDRKGILFHVGNSVEDSRGCILLGQSFGEVKDEPGILQSRNGFSFFMSDLRGLDSFILTIV